MLPIKTPSLLSLILYSTFLDSFSMASTRPIISLYAAQMGASPFVIGILVSTFAFFPILFAIRFGKWTDHLGIKKMMIYGGLGCLAALLIPVIVPTIFGLVLSQMAMGLGHNCIMTSTLTGASLANVDRDKAVAAQATVFAIGEFLGPLSSGFLYEHYGFRLTIGAAALSAAAFVLLNLFTRAYPPAAKSGKSIQTGQTFHC